MFIVSDQLVIWSPGENPPCRDSIVHGGCRLRVLVLCLPLATPTNDEQVVHRMMNYGSNALWTVVTGEGERVPQTPLAIVPIT